MKNWKILKEGRNLYKNIEYKNNRSKQADDYPFGVLRDLPRF